MAVKYLKVVTTAAVLAGALIPSASYALSSTATSISLDSGDVGTSFAVDWEKLNFDNEDLFGASIWEFSSFANNTWGFTTTISNTTAPSTSSDDARLVSWGFDTDSTVETFTLSAPTNWGAVSYPQGEGALKVDHCVFSGKNNCNGAGPNGINPESSVEFKFSFTLADTAKSSVTLSNFSTRWQSAGSNNESTDISGGEVNVVPVPAAGFLIVAMMGGFGLSAYAKRRQTT